jgi:hypothetical protein
MVTPPLRHPYNPANDVPVILTGAFDRHNFGDMLFPHICGRLLARKKWLYAGLMDRDLLKYGRHQLQSLSLLSDRFAETPVHVFHVGGELLSCSSWEAAVMLLSTEEAREKAVRLDGLPMEQLH